MNELSKQLKYKGYEFNIKIELGVEALGKTWHVVTVNDMGATNYYQKYTVDGSRLKHELEVIELKTTQWADEREQIGKSETVKLLNSLGFK